MNNIDQQYKTTIKEAFIKGWMSSHETFNAEYNYDSPFREEAIERLNDIFEEWFNNLNKIDEQH